MKKRYALAGLVAASAILVMSLQFRVAAGTAGALMSVGATVSSNCSISSPASIPFNSGGLSVVCSKGATPAIGVNFTTAGTFATPPPVNAFSAAVATYPLTPQSNTTVWNSTKTIDYGLPTPKPTMSPPPQPGIVNAPLPLASGAPPSPDSANVTINF